jgi:flavin reductase (DIM6/NTAB) family NADH-FMN oxidoreductase RutF
MSDDPIKDALHMMPYGFYSITTTDGADEVNIMVANWLVQVSFTPRMVALGLARKSYSYGLVKKGRGFVVNIFNKEDAEAIKGFTKSREKNPDKVTNASYTLSPTIGCPVVEGAAAYLECEVRVMVDAGGDHDVVIAEVVNAAVMKPGKPEDTLSLLHLGWNYAG